MFFLPEDRGFLQMGTDTLETRTDTIEKWLHDRGINEVECLVPDMSGIPRGKILPASHFLASQRDQGLRLPESIFVQTVTGDYPEEDPSDEANIDVYLRADPETMRIVPWYEEPTAQVIHDCFYSDGQPVEMAPRQVLQRVVDLYAARGLEPVVAPELEFFLVKMNNDPDYPLEPPIGRSGRPEIGRQSYGIDAVNEFDPLFEEVYGFCEKQNLTVETLHHEASAAQMEINFNHGAPLSLADQVFLFKRTLRQVALRHKVYATFMAKPMEKEPGSAMHIHQNVNNKDGHNLFMQNGTRDSDLFLWAYRRFAEISARGHAPDRPQREQLSPAGARF